MKIIIKREEKEGGRSITIITSSELFTAVQESEVLHFILYLRFLSG